MSDYHEKGSDHHISIHLSRRFKRGYDQHALLHGKADELGSQTETGCKMRHLWYGQDRA